MVRPPIESTNTIKFLCSYGGKIVPRYPDGKLRYQGGHTRVLAVPRSISFSEVMIKMGELCGTTVTLRCQLPTEDLDALITIRTDEDLANLIEEYDRAAAAISNTASSSSKVRAFLSTNNKSPKPTSLSPSPSESPNSLSPSSLSPSSSFSTAGSSSPRFTPPPPPVLAYPVSYSKPVTGKTGLKNYHQNIGCHHCCRNSSRVYLVHNGNHWH